MKKNRLKKLEEGFIDIVKAADAIALPPKEDPKYNQIATFKEKANEGAGQAVMLLWREERKDELRKYLAVIKALLNSIDHGTHEEYLAVIESMKKLKESFKHADLREKLQKDIDES